MSRDRTVTPGDGWSYRRVVSSDGSANYTVQKMGEQRWRQVSQGQASTDVERKIFTKYGYPLETVQGSANWWQQEFETTSYFIDPLTTGGEVQAISIGPSPPGSTIDQELANGMRANNDAAEPEPGTPFELGGTLPAAETPVQEASVAMVGQKFYPRLSIRGDGINFSHFIFPKNYQESYKARWSFNSMLDGRLNERSDYGGTERTISIDFVLPAKTVQEARANLQLCTNLARTAHGSYRSVSLPNFFGRDPDPGGRTQPEPIFRGAKTFALSFGNLIRNERAIVQNFAFSANLEAGVFDYNKQQVENNVYHNRKGQVLPRELLVTISFIIVHPNPLGFGGPLRPGEQLGWSQNKNKDWPHGTGPIGVQDYMKPTRSAIRSIRSVQEVVAELDAQAEAKALERQKQIAEDIEEAGGILQYRVGQVKDFFDELGGLFGDD